MSRMRLRLGKAVASTTASPLSLSVNMAVPDWWTYSTPFVDIAFSAIDTTTTGAIVGATDGVSVPDANRDSSGYVKSVPAGNTQVSIAFQLPPSTAQRQIIWASANGSGNGIAATPTVANATGVTVNLAARTITYTPSNVLGLGASSPPTLRYAPVSTTDYPINFVDRPVSDPGGVLSSDYAAAVAASCSSDFIVRFMDWTTVNRNNSPIWLGSGGDPTFQFPNLHNPSAGSEPGTQLNEPIYTSTNRNRNKADAQWHDGVPVETLVATATALGCHAWYNAAPNADNTFYDAVAALWATFASSQGKDVYLEVGNEGWNTGFTWAHQLINEANILGITSAQRYAQKTIEVANRFITAFASAGVSSRLKVVLAWQNYASENTWSSMLTFLGTTDAAKVTHLAVAPYYGDNSEMGIATSYTGSTATLKAAIATDTIASVGHTVLHLGAASALGKKLITYEGGSTVVLDDLTYKTAWAHSSDAYDLELAFLQRLELLIASQQSGGFYLNSYNFSFPLSGSSFSWGLLEYINQTRSKATTPKLQAHVDFKAGTRILTALTGSLGNAPVPATNGDSLGSLSPTAYGVTWALANNDGGRLTINPVTGEVTVANASLFTIAETGRSVTVRQVYAGDPTGFLDTVMTYNASLKYRYYRLRTTATQATGGVAFAELVGSISHDGTNLFLGKTVTVTSIFDTPFGGSNAVDGNPATFWNSDFGGTWPQDLVVDLGVGNAAALSEFKITARTGSQANQSPGDFTFAGSADNISYTTLKTVTAQTYTSGETKTFSVP